jgi:hypothetical protein
MAAPTATVQLLASATQRASMSAIYLEHALEQPGPAQPHWAVST